MADLADVEAALVGVAAAALYPAGAAAASAVGVVCRVYRGWPLAAALDGDLANGCVNVSVFSDAGGQQSTTRWLTDDDTGAISVMPELRVATSGMAVSFFGVASPGQVAGVLADGVAAVHRTQAGDTPGSVAAVLAAALRTGRVVRLSGATVSVPGAVRLLGRVVADQPRLAETRRQAQGFRVTCWCGDPATRDRVAGIVDGAMSEVGFLPLADGTVGRLRYRASVVVDRAEDAGLYRRDLHYEVEYATTVARTLPSMLFGELVVVADGGDVATLLS